MYEVSALRLAELDNAVNQSTTIHIVVITENKRKVKVTESWKNNTAIYGGVSTADRAKRVNNDMPTQYS